MTSDQKDNQPSQGPAPTVPKKTSSNAKWIAIIVVVVVIIAAVGGILAFYHPTPTVPIGKASITSASAVAAYNTPYNVTVKTNERFNSMSFYWGDGPATTISYSGSNTVSLTHTFRSPGQYYAYYTVTFNNTVYSSYKELLPISVTAASSILAPTDSYGDIALQSASAAPTVNNTWIYAPGTSISLLLGYFTPPANTSYQVVNQKLFVSLNGTQTASVALPYYFNNTSGLYELPLSKAIYNLTVSTGYYTLNLITFTAIVNSTTGAIDTSTISNTSYFVDIPAFSSAAAYSVPGVGVLSWVTAEAETGGYKTFDPAIEYDTVSYEIVLNTMATLVGYNGSSSSGFFPYLAAYLPTTTNGGINTNYANYTVHVNPALAGYNGSYNVSIKPYENYTFHIRSNATFQDGSKLTAWDVAFSFTRLLLLDAGSPGTGGWINAQYLLPGNYYASNTFWNITQNITWNNATNNVTFHFQSPMSPSLVFEVMGDTSGVQILDASWVQLHGGGIGWNASDFMAYQAHGVAGDYVSYLVNNIMASGPYMIDYTVPASEVVLIANPNYNPPGNGWEPKAKIGMVIIEYIGEESTRYLQLKSGYASTAGIASSDWYLVQGLEKSGTVNVYSFPTISIYWYNLNTNINETMLSKLGTGANIPQTFFDSIQVRRAFADSYDYSYYLAQQVGNAVYNTTFATGFAGMLPNGMLGYQSNETLKAAGVSLPTFNLTYAKQNWTAFVNSPYFAKEGLSIASVTAGGITAGDVVYNGALLNVPIMIFSADPVDVAGATTWGDYLQQVIPGLQFTVQPTPFPTLLSWQVAGSNPAPIYELGWAPDYPYPTDYLGPMAYPTSESFYPGSNGFYPAWFNGSANPVSGLPGMREQYGNLTAMVQEFLNGSTTGNPTIALKNFHMMNEMLVNMTFYVYLYQANSFWVVNSHTVPSTITNYQENVMMGGGGDLMYNYLAYT
jgi:ABC-type transport system substrate-binding protein